MTVPADALRNPETWRTELGLLPVPLHSQRQEPAYVLLNGARGNFCLDLRQIDERAGRSDVWSADLACRVWIDREAVLVQRWDEASRAPINYSANEVVSKFERFHRLLEQQTPPLGMSVVAHALDVFRRLRTGLGGGFSGEDGLQAYLALIAAATDESSRGQIGGAKWGLTDKSIEIATVVRDGEWTGLLELLRAGRPGHGLEVRLPLVLRHASGRLFQEAHYRALHISTQQLLMDGFAPDPVQIRPTTTAVGLHFTPSPLARALVEEVLSTLPRPLPNSIKAFDPACGSGEFLRELVRQLALSGFKGELRLIGWDISEGAAAMARFALAWEKQSVAFKVIENIQVQDALAEDIVWPKDVVALLMNPPFKAWRDMPGDRQSRVAAILGAELTSGRPDLAFAFLRLAADCLSEDGAIGAIIPASMLDGKSAAPLREELTGKLNPTLLARLGSQDIFHDAVVDPALYVGTRRGISYPPLAFWADHRPSSTAAALRALRRARKPDPDPSAFESGSGYSLYRNPDLASAQSWAPRPHAEWMLLRQLAARERVSDVFDVQQGALTGYNKAFLLSKSDVESLPTNEQPYFRPAVLNESFVAGRLLDTGYVFYPYGEYDLSSEAQLESELPEFLKRFLVAHKDELTARKNLPKNWWMLWRERTWQIQPRPKIVSAYFGDVGAFAWDEIGSYVVVQGYGWLPKGTTR